MSIWGVQRGGQLPTIVGTVAGADVTLTAGSAIVGFTPAAALIAPFVGTWAYFVQVFATIVLGGTAPSALVVTLATATPTVLDTLTVPAANLVNSAILPLSFALVGTGSETLYFPTGDIPTINFNCTGQAATLKFHSRAVFSFAFIGD
jgi:hypothetical protein